MNVARTSPFCTATAQYRITDSRCIGDTSIATGRSTRCMPTAASAPNFAMLRPPTSHTTPRKSITIASASCDALATVLRNSRMVPIDITPEASAVITPSTHRKRTGVRRTSTATSSTRPPSPVIASSIVYRNKFRGGGNPSIHQAECATSTRARDLFPSPHRSPL